MKLNAHILKLLEYFNKLGRPVTLDEVWRFLDVEASRVKVLIQLQYLVEQGKIGFSEPYYYTEQKIFNDFIKDKEILAQQVSKARFYANILKNLPFVRAIILTNILELNRPNNLRLIIFGPKKRVRLIEVLANFALDVFGQKKNRWYKDNKIEVEAVLSEDQMAEKISAKSYDSALIIANYRPFFDKDVYRRLLSESDLNKFLPNFKPLEYRVNREKAGVIEKFLSSDLGNILEKTLDRN